MCLRAEAGVGETRSMTPRKRLEEAVQAACTDRDVELVAYAAQNGFKDVTGCPDAIGYCGRADVVNLCSLTCATESGCSQYGLGVQQSSLAESIVDNTGNMPEIAVFSLAVIGTASIIANTFARCTKNGEYTEVSE